MLCSLVSSDVLKKSDSYLLRNSKDSSLILQHFHDVPLMDLTHSMPNFSLVITTCYLATLCATYFYWLQCRYFWCQVLICLIEIKYTVKIYQMNKVNVTQRVLIVVIFARTCLTSHWHWKALIQDGRGQSCMSVSSDHMMDGFGLCYSDCKLWWTFIFITLHFRSSISLFFIVFFWLIRSCVHVASTRWLFGIFLFIFDILSAYFISINHLMAFKSERRMPKLKQEQGWSSDLYKGYIVMRRLILGVWHVSYIKGLEDKC